MHKDDELLTEWSEFFAPAASKSVYDLFKRSLEAGTIIIGMLQYNISKSI